MASPEELRGRFAYHRPSNEGVVKAHEKVRELCCNLALALNEGLPESREKSLALTAAQETMLWSNAAIALHMND